MTAFAFCVLLFVANLLVWRHAAILLPLTGALVVVSGVRFLVQRRKKRFFSAKRPRLRVAKKERAAQDVADVATAEGREAVKELFPGGKGRQVHAQDKKTGKPEVRRKDGNVIYASFPCTDEGRQRAMEAFSKEGLPADEQDRPPLQ